MLYTCYNSELSLDRYLYSITQGIEEATVCLQMISAAKDVDCPPPMAKIYNILKKLWLIVTIAPLPPAHTEKKVNF